MIERNVSIFVPEHTSHCSVHDSLPPLPTLSQMNSFYSTPNDLLNIPSNILRRLCPVFPRGLFPSISPPRPSFPILHMPFMPVVLFRLLEPTDSYLARITEYKPLHCSVSSCLVLPRFS
jgi:hypothetical protein